MKRLSHSLQRSPQALLEKISLTGQRRRTICCGGQAQYAFTLIELLVAVSIFATIAVVLYSCFRGGAISWRRIDSEGAFQQKIRYALNKMSEDFKNTLYLSNLTFEGSVDKVAFISLMTLADDADINVGRVSYYLSFNDADIQAKTLVRKVEPLKDALYTEEPEEEKIEEQQRPEQKGTGEERLLEGISELKFSYLFVSEEAVEAEEGESEGIEGAEYEWLDFWDEDDLLPMGIKVEVALTHPENGKDIRFSKRIWIPAGKPSKQIKEETEETEE